MAAINGEQQEFALHSLNDEHKNKTFFFVKLTDSALKSIEDYMSLNSTIRQGIAKATIQFQSDSNQGAITLPTLTSSNSTSTIQNKNEIRYSFNLSNVDADGPQGSFEILRQRKLYRFEECMESLGSMFIKMQFHASDDIYQKTKVKMANAEKDAKKHSTKVIKETFPNVGRKIKKTITGNGQIGNSLSIGNANEQQSNGYSSYKDLLSVNSTFVDLNSHSPKSHSSSSKFINYKQNNSSSSSANSILQGKDDQSLSNSINNHTLTSKESVSNSSQQQQNSSSSLLNQSKSNSSLSVNHANNSTNANNQSAQQQPSNPEVIRKPIRDRIIHLLALRPYKKPELHAKLNRDGLRDKDKKGLGALLCQIANLKDNAYHLHRGAWHEVQTDDWPFYTTDERDIVRKRNPLTNSVGSTSSHVNQSNSNNNLLNTSTNTDLNSAINSSISPLATFDNQQKSPLMYHSNSPSTTNKRTIDQSANVQNSVGGTCISTVDYDYATANKKQRISHHKTNSDQQQQQIKKRSPPLIANGGSQIINNSTNQSQSITNRSIVNNSSTNNSNQSKTIGASKLTNKYDDVINIWENKPKTPDEPSQTNGHYSNSSNNNSNSHSSPELNSSVNSSNGLMNSNGNNKIGQTNDRKVANVYRNSNASSDRYHSNNISSYTNANYHPNHLHHSSANSTNSHFATFTNHHAYTNSNQQQHNSSLCSTPNSSPDSGTGSNDGSLASSTSSSRSLNSTNEDYLSKYAEITSVDQFRKYKQDFNCEYEEYKKLHNIVDRNANKFALLEQELRQAQEGTETWNCASIHPRSKMDHLFNKCVEISMLAWDASKSAISDQCLKLISSLTPRQISSLEINKLLTPDQIEFYLNLNVIDIDTFDCGCLFVEYFQSDFDLINQILNQPQIAQQQIDQLQIALQLIDDEPVCEDQNFHIENRKIELIDLRPSGRIIDVIDLTGNENDRIVDVIDLTANESQELNCDLTGDDKFHDSGIV